MLFSQAWAEIYKYSLRNKQHISYLEIYIFMYDSSLKIKKIILEINDALSSCSRYLDLFTYCRESKSNLVKQARYIQEKKLTSDIYTNMP